MSIEESCLQDCDVPCHTLQVTVSGKNYRKHSENSTGLVYLYFAQKVPKSTEHYLYLFLSFIAEIGGYVGLLLGYSLFNAAAFANSMFGGRIKAMEENEKRDRGRVEIALQRWTGSMKKNSASEDKK